MPPFPSDPTCPFRRRRKEARPAELLEAALALFVAKGFAATKSEEVARAAGVSKGTLYLYFPSKEELLKAVIQHFLVNEIAAGVEQAAALDDGPTPEIMTQLLVDWWSRVHAGPASGVFKLIVTEVVNFPDIAQFYVERVIEPGNAIVGRLLERGIQRGEFATMDIDFAVHSLLMPMVLLCVNKHSLGACGFEKHLDEDPAGFMREHLRVVLRGLAAPNPPQMPHSAPGGARRDA
jgi:AcrR family transcriptional regulator